MVSDGYGSMGRDGSGTGRLDLGLAAGYGVPGGYGEFGCMVGDMDGGGVCGSAAAEDSVTDLLLIEVAKLCP